MFNRLKLAVSLGFGMVLACGNAALASPPAAPNPPDPHNWGWVKGAVFVPTNATNEAEEWDEYDPVTNDRELQYAHVYGLNCVCVYLDYFVYLKKKDALLRNFEDFLVKADKHRLKVHVIFFDDCHNEPSRDIMKADYKYPPPVFGVHNSRWLLCPGADVLSHYDEEKTKLKAYVQDVVSAHKDDKRIVLWETYNEPKAKSPGVTQLEKDAIGWVHETGTKIPDFATSGNRVAGGQFSGGPYSDIVTYHMYKTYAPIDIEGPKAFCTECMNRDGQTIPGIVEHFAGKTGFEIWEFGIGRDNCRFPWGDNKRKPGTAEPKTPFHGMIYPDGHPWDVADAKAFLGSDYSKAPLFNVEYFKDDTFGSSVKKSVTPMIDFDLPDEVGIGSPDPQAGIPREKYSARWTGMLQPAASGSYKISVMTDGTAKITVNGKQIVQQQGAGEASATVDLSHDAPAPIVVEYAHHAGAAKLHVMWTVPGSSEKTAVTPVASAK